MKQVYFSDKTIDSKSKEMLKAIFKQKKRRKLEFNISHSALIVLDMQKYFLNNSSHSYIPSAVAIIPRIKKLIRLFNSANRPVILTRHINTIDDSGLMGKWWKDLIKPRNTLGEIINDFKDEKYISLKKTQYDAFYKTPLEEILTEKNTKQVLITGVMANLCCETTARSAFTRGFETFFTIDGTAAYNEQFHNSTLINLAFGFAIPVLTEEIVKLFKKKI